MTQDQRPDRPAQVAEGHRQRPLRVLVLDDEPMDRLRLTRLCQRVGLEFRVTEAASLSEFRHALEQDAFDLIFIDYYLGLDNGLDAVRILRHHDNQSNAISIMITSVDSHQVVLEAMRSGCADYLVKEELSLDSLRKAIVAALERQMFVLALAEAEDFRAQMQARVARFSDSSGAELRETLHRVQAEVETLLARRLPGSGLGAELGALSEGCEELGAFLDAMADLLDGTPPPRAALRFHT